MISLWERGSAKSTEKVKKWKIKGHGADFMGLGVCIGDLKEGATPKRNG